jgi:hypothetical protein
MLGLVLESQSQPATTGANAIRHIMAIATSGHYGHGIQFLHRRVSAPDWPARTSGVYRVVVSMLMTEHQPDQAGIIETTGGGRK